MLKNFFIDGLHLSVRKNGLLNHGTITVKPSEVHLARLPSCIDYWRIEPTSHPKKRANGLNVK